MKILTSIAPVHKNGEIQLEAVRSWKRLGQVISFNNPSEIPELEKIYGDEVTFVPTYRTHEAKFGKPYVGVSALVDYAKEHEGFYGIINSDCVLSQEANLDFIHNGMKQGFVYLHRWDWEEDMNKATQYRWGVDGFFFHSSVAKDLPQTDYCLGHCYFDIAYPYLACIAGYNLYCEDRYPVLYHKMHNAQYRHEDWVYYGKYTAFLLDKVMRPADLSQLIYGFLQQNTRYASKHFHQVVS